MPRPLPLHFVRASPKVAVGTAPRHIRFLFLHGLLAHSGSLNSLVVNLRRRLDSYNNAVLSSSTGPTSVSGKLVDYDMVSIDARNHGLSPHTTAHTLPDLVADLGDFLRLDNTPGASGGRLPNPPQTSMREAQVGQQRAADAGRRETLTVAIGHSMGSGTLAYYLIQQQALQRSGENPSGDGEAAGVRDGKLGAGKRTPAALLHGRVDAFVAMDMPPITAEQIPRCLCEDLSAMMAEMEKVTFSNITDMRSAHDEFLRCGFTDMRLRGLCSTNILIDRATAPSTGGRPSARWKCNLPVLKRSLADGSVFLPVGFEGAEDVFAFPLGKQLPVLSILGGDSPIGGERKYQEVWPQFASNLEQHIVPGATHTVFYDRPDETAELIESFLFHIGILIR